MHEHTELAWLLGAVCAHGDLNRMHQFKDKSATQRELVSAGLFSYPVLQAADVLAYRADEVPVGEDQRQHIELMREIARRFNERFGDTLTVPEHRIPEVGAKIMDLQEPDRKMSTTVGADSGRVYVLDEEKAIRKKFGSAVTDSGREIRRGGDKAGIANLIGIYSVARGISEDEVEAEFEGKGYGDFKKAVADAAVEFLAPVREAYPEIRADEAELERRLALGAGPGPRARLGHACRRARRNGRGRSARQLISLHVAGHTDRPSGGDPLRSDDPRRSFPRFSGRVEPARSVRGSFPALREGTGCDRLRL